MAHGIHERYNLYSTPEAFYLEPRLKDGSLADDVYMYIDKAGGEIGLAHAMENPIPMLRAEVRPIYGLWGTISLIGGNYLILITGAEVVGTLNDAEIYHITASDIVPYKASDLHLTARQKWYNSCYVDMLRTVLTINGFYYSPTFDLSRSMQFLGENTSPEFVSRSLYERAASWLCWNRFLIAPFAKRAEMRRFTVPIILGFVGIRRCEILGRAFKLILISRRPTDRPGVRFMTRGAGVDGATANFVETEQIVEADDGTRESRRWTSFLQMRGSIPLLWSQKPNLRWQPQPYMRPQDDQLDAYVRHMQELKKRYGGNHVLVNLVNQRGREHRIGSELARVSLQASLDFVKYIPFDFHNECKNLDWSGLTALRQTLDFDLRRFGFFSSSISRPDANTTQGGFIRSNCMDCLDRTNVVQAMVAKESLRYQLRFLGLINDAVGDLDMYPEFAFVFRNDNGDECSRQYAGTGALKTDYTRCGTRTMNGVINDGINALTRYFKNNFTDGHKLDAMNLFLGCFNVSDHEMPEELEEMPIGFNINGAAVAGAVFSAAITLLCIFMSENITATLFWFVIFFAFASLILLNGEEFVRKPKLKVD